MKKEKVNVIVVDDHQLFRKGIVAILNNITYVEVVGEAPDGHAALQLLQEKDVDILILDLNMPGLNGMGTCNKMLKKHPDVRILILSWHCAPRQVIDLLEVGASGFLSKECSKEELLNAVQIVAQGGSYFSQSISEIIVGLKIKNGYKSARKESKLSLTGREMEVLECIANEYTNKEIATQLYISQRTVETHRRNLIQKLQVKNTVGLVKYYFSVSQNPNKHYV